jgi:hypothetical protein
MNEIRTILIPFNFSRTAERALSYAVDYVGKDESLKILLAYIGYFGSICASHIGMSVPPISVQTVPFF